MPRERKLELFREIGYVPSAEQMAIHMDPAFVKQVTGGERAGKSFFTAKEALTALCPQPDDDHPRRLAFAAKKYKETRAEMRYLLSDCQELGLIKGKAGTPKDGKWTWETTLGGSVESISFEDGAQELTGTGLAFDCVVVCEAGRVPENPLENCVGRVSETDGLVLFSGTLWDSTGWYNDLAEQFLGPNPFEGRTFPLPSWSNTAVYPGGRSDPKILKWEKRLAHIPGAFERRIAGKPTPSPARYYPEFDPSLHVDHELQYSENHPVYLSIDPGYFPTHYVVHAYQLGVNESGQESLLVVDEVYENHKGHQQIIGICRARPWWGNVRDITGGHETKGHHYTDLSTQEVWRQMTQLPFSVIRKPNFKMHEVMRVHTFLFDPESDLPRLFIAPHCFGLLSEFPAYKRRTDSNHKVISDEPAPGLFDDALDALTNFLLARYGLVEVERRKPVPGRSSRGARG